jgi:hypothetical protein
MRTRGLNLDRKVTRTLSLSCVSTRFPRGEREVDGSSCDALDEWSARRERYVLEEDPDREFRTTADEAPRELGETDTGIQSATQRTQLALDRTARVRAHGNFTDGHWNGLQCGVRLLIEPRATAEFVWVQTAHFVGVCITATITLLLTIAARNYLTGTRLLAVIAHRTPPGVAPAFMAAVLAALLGLAVLAILIVIGD